MSKLTLETGGCPMSRRLCETWEWTACVACLFLRHRRQQSVQSQIHRSHAVVIGPTAREAHKCPGSRPRLAVKPRNLFVHLRVIRLRQGGVAKLERGLDSHNELVFALSTLQLLAFGLRHVANVGAKVVVALHDVRGKMSERHLIGCGLVTELVGGHFFKRSDSVLFAAV